MNIEKKKQLKIELTTYGFRRLIEHVVKSGAPERILTTAGRRWLITKAQYYGYGSAVLADLYTIAKHIGSRPSNEKQLVDLIDIALWKISLTPSHVPPLFALEEAVRARMGEPDRAVNQVNHFGSEDDQVLVHAEVALLKKRQSKDLVEEHLKVIAQAVAQGVRPEIIEFVAVQMAPDFPDLSIRLAASIPAPKHFCDVDSQERPSHARCLWRIFTRMAEHDFEQAKYVRHGLTTPMDRLYANLGIAEALIKKNPVGLRKHVEELLHDLPYPDTATPLTGLVTTYIIREAASLPIAQYMKLINDLSEIAGTAVLFDGLIFAIDGCLRKNVNATVAALSEIHEKNLKDIVYWRLSANHVETNGLCITEDTVIGRDLIQADIVTSKESFCADDVRIMSFMKTKIGATRLLVNMAEKMVHNDWPFAQVCLKDAFHVWGDDNYVAAWYSRFEVLRILMCKEGSYRNHAVDFCISGLRESSCGGLIHQMAVELGRCIAAAFSDWDDQEQKFLTYVNDRCKKSKQSSSIRKGIINGLSEAACLKLARILLEKQGHIDTAISPMTTDADEADLLKGDSEFISYLAVKVATFDKELATLLFKRAAAIVSLCRDGDDRERRSRLVNHCALLAIPRLAWKVHLDSGCSAYAFAEAAGIVLRQCVDLRKGLRSCWLRSCLEFTLCQAELKSQRLSKKLVRKGLALEQICKDPLATAANDNWRISYDWCQGIVEAFRNYILGVKKNGWVEYQLKRAMDSLAILDWQSFITIIRDEEIGENAASLIKHDMLFDSLLRLDKNLGDILRDIEHIRKALGTEREEIEGTVDEIRNWILVCGAMFAPEFASEVIPSVLAHSTTRFMEGFKYVSPQRSWNSRQIRRYVDGLQGCLAQVDSLIAHTILVKWLAGAFSIDIDFYNELYVKAKHCEDSSVKYLVAQTLKPSCPESSAKLIVEALKQSEKENNGEVMFNCLADIYNAIEHKSNDKRDDADKFYAALKNEWAKLHGRNFPATLKVDDAVTLLARLNIKDAERSAGTIRSAALIVALEGVSDIALLSETVRGNKAIAEKVQEEFICLLVERAIKENRHRWSEIAHLVRNQKERVKLLARLINEAGTDTGNLLTDLATYEAEQLEPMDQTTAFRQIADSLVRHNPSRAVSLYENALQSASQHKNGSALLATAKHIVDVSIRHDGLGAKVASTRMREMAQCDLFDDNQNYEFDDWDRVCLFTAGLVLWPIDHERFQKYCREAVEEKRSISEHNPFWHFLLRQVYESAYSVHGSVVALRLFKEILHLLPKKSHSHLAEGVVTFCLPHGSSVQRFRHYFLWRCPVKPEYIPLINSLLPLCGKVVASLAHLSLAISGRKDGSLVDPQELDEALRLGGDEIPEPDHSFKRDLLTINAIVHGTDGITQSLLQLLPDTYKQNFNLRGIIAAAANSVAKPDQFLSEIWSRINKPYYATSVDMD